MAAEHPGAPVATAPPGREREAARLDELVQSAARGPRFVAIRGEAGIGKTVMWRWALDRLRRTGNRVLVTLCSEEESQGAMVGLIDLFEDQPVDQRVLLPDVDRLERGHLVLEALRTLSADRPTVVAIDDVPWLDPVSAAALRYAFRRLDHDPVTVLVTERMEPDAEAASTTIPSDRSEHLVLGPVSRRATRHIVSSTIGALPRPALQRVHELSGGNPMYAIELARAVHRFDDPLVASVPPTLRDAVSARIGAVSPAVRSVLRVAAALGPSDAATIAGVAGIADAAATIADAVGQGLLVVGPDGIVRFDHPLVSASVLAAMNPVDRQALHGRLADVVTDPDARARHLVHSCAEPDADVAAELEGAAGRAARRGASALAADLAAHAVRVTPLSDERSRVRRSTAAIRHRAAAGDTVRALSETDALVASLPPGRARAEVIAMRVGIDYADADRYLEQALDEAGDDDLLRGRVLEMRAWMATMHRSQPTEGLADGEQALALARSIGDRTVEMLASSTVAMASSMLGRPRPELMEHAIALDTSPGDARLGHTPAIVKGRVCLWSGRLGEARATFEQLASAYVSAGLEFQRPYRLFDLALLELAAGDVTRAAELADDGIEAAGDGGNEQATAWLAYPAGLAAAHLGDTDRAERWAGLLRTRGMLDDGHSRLVMADHVLGMAAMAAGRPSHAAAEMRTGVDRFRSAGVLLPAMVPIVSDFAEAVALSGDVRACAHVADEMERRAAAVDEPWVTAAAVRGRGLAAFAAGDADAVPRLGEAAAIFDELGYRLDAARALLLQAKALRRAGLRRRSAEALADAQARFRALGTEPWEAQTEAEIRRVAPTRETTDLTPTESRVVALVAAGRRNREIAGELNISVATVEAHLTRIYRKLQVRSRTELVTVVR